MTGKVLIIGAGLGGLTAALALQRQGFDVQIHERAPQLGEVGAGLTLSRGAQNVFRELDVMHLIAPMACRSSAFPFLHYQTGRVLTGAIDASEGLADDGVEDVSRQIHRADLHAALSGAFEARTPGKLFLNHDLKLIEDTADGVRAHFTNGEQAEGDVIIAADGVRSSVRGLLFGDDQPRFTGQIAYRFLVPIEKAKPFLQFGRGAVFLGPKRTFNRYTVRMGQLLNCVGIVSSNTWIDDGWSTQATLQDLQMEFDGWHPEILSLIGQSESRIKWGLFDRAPLKTWIHNKVALLGDAAHAMLPFLGMGAAMAIEDGMVLARAFEAKADIGDALKCYQASRLPRTNLVHAKSKEQGELTQARDPDTYDAGSAPANDPGIMAYNPVTVELSPT